jgi:hypothetical protein
MKSEMVATFQLVFGIPSLHDDIFYTRPQTLQISFSCWAPNNTLLDPCTSWYYRVNHKSKTHGPLLTLLSWGPYHQVSKLNSPFAKTLQEIHASRCTWMKMNKHCEFVIAIIQASSQVACTLTHFKEWDSHSHFCDNFTIQKIPAS